MFDCFLAHSLCQKLRRHVHVRVEVAYGTDETLVRLFKPPALALSDSEIVPDARIIWGEFHSPLQMFLRIFKIAGPKQQEPIVVQILRIVFVTTNRSLEGLECTIRHAFAAVSNTEKILYLG